MYGSLDTSPEPASPTPSAVSSAIAAPGALIKEKIPAAPDTDTATRQTIAKMCEYIAGGVNDEVCRWWAQQARERWAQGAGDCWGVWWMVKHAVKFAKDEPRLFQIGEPDALDLLIAPAVLVREPDRKEDCDGFTMLVCCLLQILGIPSVIVTVAADPSDPERWSHVFAMAQVNGTYFPMDCSHGIRPGWMVPREHITRWQAWDLKGNPVQAFPSATNTLHGYVPRGRPMRRRGMRGLGQDDGGSFVDPSVGDSGGAAPIIPTILGPTAAQAGLTEVGGVVPNGVTSFVAPSSSGSDTDWTSVINSLFSGGLKAAQLATLPAGYTMGANGQLVYTGQSAANAQLTSSFAGILPWLAIGLVAAVVVTPLLGSKR